MDIPTMEKKKLRKREITKAAVEYFKDRPWKCIAEVTREELFSQLGLAGALYSYYFRGIPYEIFRSLVASRAGHSGCRAAPNGVLLSKDAKEALHPELFPTALLQAPLWKPAYQNGQIRGSRSQRVPHDQLPRGAARIALNPEEDFFLLRVAPLGPWEEVYDDVWDFLAFIPYDRWYLGMTKGATGINIWGRADLDLLLEDRKDLAYDSRTLTLMLRTSDYPIKPRGSYLGGSLDLQPGTPQLERILKRYPFVLKDLQTN